MKILIADDDLVSRMVLSATLKQLGHGVVGAENGQEAWNLFESEHTPLLISDWMMPYLDGLELCRKIRAENRAQYTYIILLTALGGKKNYLDGMEAGADDFITKPFDRDELVARLSVAERILRLQIEVKQLQELLPICAWCKKIRSGSNAWMPLEQYVAKRTGTFLSHGICPECIQSQVNPGLGPGKQVKVQL